MTGQKLYIMAATASGKSTFARQHGRFEGIQVIDFAQYRTRGSMARRVLHRLIPRGRSRGRGPHDPSRRYFDAVVSLMRCTDGPLVVLGSRTPEGRGRFETGQSIRCAMVLIPEAVHRQYCAARRRDEGRLFGLVPHWSTNFDQVRRVRERMIADARQHDIPLFDSFEAAILAFGLAPPTAPV